MNSGVICVKCGEPIFYGEKGGLTYGCNKEDVDKDGKIHDN